MSDRSQLGLELIELAYALDAIRLIADAERDACFGSPAATRKAARAISATIQLVTARLRHLGGDLAGRNGST